MHKDLNQLYNEKIKQITEHECAVTEEDYKRIMPKIEMIQRLAEIERSIYAVCDVHRCNFLLQSEEQKKLFDFSDDCNEHDIGLDAHFKHIHPDDLAFVLETDDLVIQFFSQIPYPEKKDYKLVYNFRTRNLDGVYKHFMHQSIVLELDKNGKTWLVLIISHLLSDREAREQPQRRLINIKTGKLHLFNEIDDTSPEVVLSKREVEILNLIARGYDSINISDRLHISINTVNNHRQNILRKTKTESTTQAVLYCRRLGVI